MKNIFTLLILIAISGTVYGQVSPCNCSANVGSGNVNFSSLTWSPAAGCPTAGSTSFTGNLCLSLDNAANLIMDKNFTLTGGFGMSNNGNSKFTLPQNKTLNISGNMGDNSNNNVTFAIDGTLIVGGGIYGKNSNAFDATGTGTGSVTAGSLNFTGNPSCTSPTDCSGITWNIPPGQCSPAGQSFCNNVALLPVSLISFSATVKENFVVLSWSTATEKNASHFVIERSIDGKSFF